MIFEVHDVSDVAGTFGVKVARRNFLGFCRSTSDATVMPMQLRANLGNRLYSALTARYVGILGEKVLWAALGKGHLAAAPER